VKEIRHIVARGRVQGVGYRAFVAEEAQRRGIQGWVRNRRDGTVEALLAGSPESLAGIIQASRRGPFGARVETIEESDGSADDLAKRRPGESFSLLPTV
jgi:acylphosphatase